MRKSVSPGVAAAVIVVVVAIVAGMLYIRSNGASARPIKPGDMMQNPQVREAVGKAFRDQQGKGGQ